ncbi:MAG: HEAT repeat domain-containing protein [Gemmataceae bacterium]
MNTRIVAWLLAGSVGLLAFGLLYPKSPIYFSKVWKQEPIHNGVNGSEWRGKLHSEEPDKRAEAIFAIGAMGLEDQQVIRELATMLCEDKDINVRGQASLALIKMGQAAQVVVPQIGKGLSDEDAFVRHNCALALYKMGPGAKEAIPQMLEALPREENQTPLQQFAISVNGMTSLALGRATAGTDVAVGPLLDSLKKAKTDHIRQIGVRALGLVGPPAKPAAEYMRTLLPKASQDLKEIVQEALKTIEG